MASRVCPYLGMFDDAETPLAFASPKNTCFRASPNEAVSLEHQLACCLTERYSGCPVLLRDDAGPLPPELRLHGGSPTWGRTVLVGGGLLLVVALIFLGFLNLGSGEGLSAPVETPAPGGLPGGAAPVFQQSPTSGVLLSEPVPSATSVPAPDGSAGGEIVSPSPMPSATRTSAPEPTACVPPDGWVLYTVQSGDTLFGLGLLVNETVPALQAANCMEESTLLTAGQQIYLPFLPPPPATPTPAPTTPSPTMTVTQTPTFVQSPTVQATEPPPTDVPTPTTVPPLPTEVPSPTATLVAETPEVTPPSGGGS